MTHRVDVFDDFHLHGASAPEWNQRYVQLSPGAMHSSLTEAVSGSLHVFRKWMSERVVQQGCLPPGKICFALLNGGAQGMPRAQGYDLHKDHLFILRGGEEFTIQRPKGMELLAVTFEAENFAALLDQRPWQPQARELLRRQVLQAPAASVEQLRAQLLAAVVRPVAQRLGPLSPSRDLATSTSLFESLRVLFEDSSGVRKTASAASAGFIVAECQRIVADSGDSPPGIEALCQRLGTSRRTLQNSFRQTADTTAVHYLRGVRLNRVRSRLMSTDPTQLSVSQAAADQGFVHLSHFTERYKALFGELPSQTCRAIRFMPHDSPAPLRPSWSLRTR